MIKEIVLVPAVGLLLIGVALELEQIAQSSAGKAVSFAEDMDKAMDCATAGIPVRVCSPELFKDRFKEDINSTITTLSQIQDLNYSGL